MVDFARHIGKPSPPPPQVPSLVFAITGHRPSKLPDKATGYDRMNPMRQWLRDEMRQVIETLRADPRHKHVPFAAEMAAIARAEAKAIKSLDPSDVVFAKDFITTSLETAHFAALSACFQNIHESEALLRHPPDEPNRLIALAERLEALPQLDRFRASHVDSYLRQVVWKDPTAPRPPVLALSGVALGVDQDFCGVCARLSPPSPYVAVVPFPGQEERWPKASQAVYAAVLEHAVGVVVVTKEQPRSDDKAKEFMKRRNHWMCDCSDELVAVFDGSIGGTYSAVSYWQRSGRRLQHRIDPRNYTGA